ncbi:unnamed protein product [Haemonchus placei]|uniref:Uncharacterized protein n=1 Tax=Haemonchus placei TaxID=6290 RepID=A0A158QKR7_HAEPC|nr:unnamed protein product [Haemonchus placei]
MAGRDEDEVNMEEAIEDFLQEPGVSSDDLAFSFKLISKELKRMDFLLKQIPRIVNEKVREHKVSGRYKEKHAEIVRREVDKICEEVEMLASNCKTTTVIKREIFEVLHIRGIETEEDWEQYICTIEKDGEILSTVCEELNTDALQVVKVAKELKKADAPRYTDVDNGKDSNGECADSKNTACDGERDNLVLQSAPALRIGAPYDNKEDSNVGKVSRSTDVRETRKEDKEITKQGYLEKGSGNPHNHPPRIPERRSSGGPCGEEVRR